MLTHSARLLVGTDAGPRLDLFDGMQVSARAIVASHSVLWGVATFFSFFLQSQAVSRSGEYVDGPPTPTGHCAWLSGEHASGLYTKENTLERLVKSGGTFQRSSRKG